MSNNSCKMVREDWIELGKTLIAIGLVPALTFVVEYFSSFENNVQASLVAAVAAGLLMLLRIYTRNTKVPGVKK